MAKGAGATYSSIRQLAKAVGKSHAAVAKWVRHPSWGFSRRGPWRQTDVAAITAWAASNLSPNPAAGESAGGVDGQSAKSKAQTLLALRRARSVELDNLIKEKKFHSAEACRARRVRQLEDLKRRFLDIPDRLPLNNVDRDIVRREIRDALNAFSAGYTQQPFVS